MDLPLLLHKGSIFEIGPDSILAAAILLQLLLLLRLLLFALSAIGNGTLRRNGWWQDRWSHHGRWHWRRHADWADVR